VKTREQALIEELRLYRTGAGVRQFDLASLLNKPQSFVSKYECGDRTLTFVDVLYICEALNISVDELSKKVLEIK